MPSISLYRNTSYEKVENEVRCEIAGSVPLAFRRRLVSSYACSGYLGDRRNRLSGTRNGSQKKPEPVCV